MADKINFSQLAELFAKASGMPKGASDDFVHAFFDIISDSIVEGDQVKVRGFGTFKQTEMGARESVNVNTGERFTIAGHAKITFTPDQVMKDLINKPFADFEIVTLSEEEVNAIEESDVQEPVKKPSKAKKTSKVEETVKAEEVVKAEEPSKVEEELVKSVEPAKVEEEPVESVEPAKAKEEPVETVEPVKVEEPVEEEKPVKVERPVKVFEPETMPDPKKDVKIEKKGGRNIPLKILLYICAVLLVLLLVSYCIWPLNLLHILQVNSNKLVKTTPVEQVEAVTVVNPSEESVTIASDSLTSETQEPDTQSDSVIQEETKQSDSKSEEADKPAETNKVETTKPAETKPAESKPAETKPAEAKPAETVKQGVSTMGTFKLNAQDEAKDLGQFTIADTVNYKIIGTKAVHVLTSDETLTLVARKYYGSKKLWPYIVAYNGIKDTKKVAPGQKIKIPELANK